MESILVRDSRGREGRLIVIGSYREMPLPALTTVRLEIDITHKTKRRRALVQSSAMFARRRPELARPTYVLRLTVHTQRTRVIKYHRVIFRVGWGAAAD